MGLIEDLKLQLSDDRVTSNETMIYQHSKDESFHTPQPPEVVVFPHSTEEVSRVLKYAYENNVPVTPYAIGSGLEGGAIPEKGGISLDMMQMNKVLEVRPRDFLVRVQPGVTRIQLNKELKKYGLFFSVDPGADASLGGMAATNASGTTAVRYGVMRDQVRDLEVVLADGTVMRTGGMYAKSSSGYNLSGLFVGSEGTLGVITELTLRVYGIPEVVMAARVVFPDVKTAVDTAVAILQAGIPVARVELVDARSVKQVNLHSGTDYLEEPTLFLEFHGNEAGLKQDLIFAEELAKAGGCLAIEFETDSIRRAQLWEARHNLAYAFIHGFPKKKQMVTDVCLPLTELTGAVVEARRLLDEMGLDGAVLGHVGDGNFHTILMFDPGDPEDVKRSTKYNELLVEYAISRGGTCTGEHGVGLGKRKYQQKQHGESLKVMAAIKQMLDPKGILNPEKVLP